MEETHHHHEHHHHQEHGGHQGHGRHHHHHHKHHHHHHHAAVTDRIGVVYVVAVLANLLFTVVEALAGWWGHSMSLLSDAGHNFSDVCSLMLALLAFKLSQTRSTQRFTYGYRKSSVLISLCNAVLLLAVVVVIIVESLRKFAHPAEVSGALISWTAAVGILINGVTAWALSSHRKHDINARGAFLHMLADTLVSLGVVVSGIIISYTGWYIADPIVGLVIALVILVSTARLLLESIRMSVDAVPEEFDTEKIVSKMKGVEEVCDVHHVHIWPISTTDTALTAHVVVKDYRHVTEVMRKLKQLLAEIGLKHSTLEMETPEASCENTECEPFN